MLRARLNKTRLFLSPVRNAKLNEVATTGITPDHSDSISQFDAALNLLLIQLNGLANDPGDPASKLQGIALPNRL